MSETRTNELGVEFHVGDSVRLRDKRKIAQIKGFYAIQTGGVFLDRELDGLRSWNVDDLERVPSAAVGHCGVCRSRHRLIASECRAMDSIA